MHYGRAIKYYVVYFLGFSFFAWLRFMVGDNGIAHPVPGYAVPGEIALPMFCFFAAMSLRLIVTKPIERFAFERARRWMRLAVYLGIFFLAGCLGPIYLGSRFHSPYSWLAAFVPLILFLLMTKSIQERYVNPALHPPTDSWGRPFKYFALYWVICLPIGVAFGLILGRFFHAYSAYFPLFAALLQYMVLLPMLYRLMVNKPHSRFAVLSISARRRRFAGYTATYVFFTLIAPVIARFAWRWQMPAIPFLELPLFMVAALGTDARMFKDNARYANPFKSGKRARDMAIKRRLAEQTQQRPS